MRFRFEDYKGDYIMWCKTEEEAKDFCRVMHESGRKWGSGDSYIKCSRFTDYLGETCYNFNSGSFAHKNWYKRYDFTILEWEDFMEKELTLSDLNVGMLIEIRRGDKFIIAQNEGDIFGTNDSEWLSFDNFEEDMRYYNRGDYYFDIVKVYGRCKKNNGFYTYDTTNRDLLFQRKEKKELTMQEIADKFGIPVDQLKIKK